MRQCRGFSLLELITALAIAGILMSLAAPAYMGYVANSRICATAQSFNSGLQLARTEAIRRNVNVDFVLTNDTAPSQASTASNLGRGWVVRTTDGVTFIEGKQLNEGGSSQNVVNDSNNDGTANAGAVSTITFNGMGMTTLPAGVAFTFTNPNGGACATATQTAPMRCLNIAVARGGQSLICDPAVTAASDNRRCP